ncbi:MAG: leucine--tRNA ligase [Candidatus Yonathbacteria bacterium]|nr:leucine--tRNA ligase [Candidatus Yonathbacteria bacterium]
MAEKYDHKKVEKKWQAIWEAAGMYRADEKSAKPKKYVLDMFPYPSGDGLHVGHAENYTATCIYSRYMRMKGFNVLHPIGWDAFGLPAENYAIKTNVHPDESTHKNIKTFSEQIKTLGISYDWTREIDTSSPEYYRWTQWFFLLLYKNGFAYKKKAKVNWCDSCKTVLANEQAEGGVCERCKNMVAQKDLEQWFFKITHFAEDLIKDLDTVDWPSSTVAQQRNWIGKSEGVEFGMDISETNESIRVYTTRIDTVFGMTYVVLAPEHQLVERLRAFIKNSAEVLAYIETTKKKTELERTELAKEKTGVRLDGLEAVNPFTGKPVPIFIADYVLGNYGTGAVMAVPAHDERDFLFAKKFDLPVVMVVCPHYPSPTCPVLDEAYTGDGKLVMSGEFDGLTSSDARERMAEWLEKKEIGFKKVNYRLRDWLVSRQRYWGAPIPIIYCTMCGEVPVPEDNLPVLLPKDVDFRPTGESPLALSESFHNVSCPKCGMKAKRESDTMDTFVCSSWYYLRFADPKNKTAFAGKGAMEKWLPVDMYMGGAEHTVLHLLYARFFTKVLNSFGFVSFKEPFMKLRHQGMILGADGRKMSKSLGNVENPNKYIESDGADALRLYEMFMGPLADMKPWNPNGIIGPRRFLERVWRLKQKVLNTADEKAIDSVLHKTIKKVGDDIEEFSFNTAISAMMILVNEMEKLEVISKGAYETLLLLLSPFAPHITDELWHDIGNTKSIHLASFPVFDSSKCIASEITIAIQIGGKLRGTIVVERDTPEDTIKGLVLARPDIAKWVNGKIIKKIIMVKGKLLNIVVGD